MKISESKYLTIDKTILDKLQVLKKFVDFVAMQKETSVEHKSNAEKVKYFIANLDKPETFVDHWNICIDIYDTIIQSGSYGHNYEENNGLYWKKWWVWFEMGELTVRIVEEFVDKEGYQNENRFFFSSINFNNDWKHERIIGDTNFNYFVEDALNFRKYITKDLNDVETEIDI